MLKNIWQKLRQRRIDNQGSITVEFVIWFPVLMFWLIGTIVFFDAFKARGNLNTANATVSDIVSRNSEISEDYVNLLFVLQTSMLPRTTNNGLRISSILFTGTPGNPASPGFYTVEWSGIAGSFIDELQVGDIPPGTMPDMYDTESVLLIESSVPFEPLTAFFGITFRTLRSEITISPRYDARVVWVNP